MDHRRVPRGRVAAAALVAVAVLAFVGVAASAPRIAPTPTESASGLIGSAPPMASASRPGATAAIHEYGGDSTGSSDVTEDLQRFIDGVPDGSVIHFRQGGEYRLDCTVWISHRNGLTFDGQGARFFVPSGVDCPSQTIWRFNAGGGHTIRNMTIEGNHPEPGTYQPPHEFQVGIETLGTVGIEIADITMRRAYGDCVHVGYDNQPGGNLEWSGSVWIHGLDCAGNGRQGIAVTGGRGVLIERSRFADQAYIVFDIEPDEPPNGAAGITIRDNVISGRGDSPMVSIGGAGDVSDILVERNRVLDGENRGSGPSSSKGTAIGPATSSSGTTSARGCSRSRARPSSWSAGLKGSPSAGTASPSYRSHRSSWTFQLPVPSRSPTTGHWAWSRSSPRLHPAIDTSGRPLLGCTPE